MGFNIEEYEMYDNDNYSNALGFGCELIINKKRKAECEKARDARKGGNAENVTADTALSKGAFCVKGTPIYSPGFYLLTPSSKRTQNRLICKARKEAKMKDDVAPSDAVKDNPATDAEAPADTVVGGSVAGGTPDTTKSNTGLYIGIGAGVLLLGIVTVVLLTRKRK